MLLATTVGTGSDGCNLRRQAHMKGAATHNAERLRSSSECAAYILFALVRRHRAN